MKETRFIAQNKEKWNEAEKLLDSDIKDPEKLSNLFIQVVDDLSYSRTYYPNRSVRVYLNKIARQYFSIIYSHRKEKRNQFMLFWTEELPQIMVYARRPMLISFLVFSLAMAIGVFSSANDPQFVNVILGDTYVTMTEENIKKGDPMAVYKDSHQIDMFLGITLNNLMVAFRTYVLGIFVGIGTLSALLYNGIMVGSFQYYFAQKGLFIESASTIWLHGTLEISSIILAGGAGLTLGSGLIFPGTYSRLQSLQISGIRSLKLMLGISPIFVLAAIIESFITRYTEAPAFLKLALILLSAAFIVGYFVIYPWWKSKTGFAAPLKELRLPPTNREPVNFTRVKNNADVLKDTFQFYSRYSAKILSWALLAAAGVSAALMFFEEETYLRTETEWWISLLSNMFFALNTPSPPYIFINAMGMSIVFYRVMQLVHAESKKTAVSFDIKSFIQVFVVALAICSGIYLDWWGTLLATAGFGILIFSAFIQISEESNLMYGFSRAWELFGKNNNQGLSLQFIVLLLSFCFLLVLTAPVLYMHTSVIEWNFVSTDVWSQRIIHFVEMFIKIFSFYLLLPVIAASFSYLYFSQEEVFSATHLKESISKMGARLSKSKR